MKRIHGMRSMLVAGVLVAIAAVLAAGAVSAAGANVIHVGGALTVYANPYGNGAPNPIADGEATITSVATPNGKTIVSLHVSGLPANREFGSHVHILACDDNKAGGHYRDDPAGPASPNNEIWLDFTTNASGHGEAHAVVDWTIRSDGAKAIIIHDHSTDGAGVAGAKLACLNVDF